MRGDKDRIQQIIENLIVNSIKYGKIGGETEVAVVNLTKEKVLIRISDDGEGIENKISLGFLSVLSVNKSGSRSEGGSGLGLAIVKHIIEAQGKNIRGERIRRRLRIFFYLQNKQEISRKG
jgi:two-component system phosphate regulon sensor histidine kinase PhoR